MQLALALGGGGAKGNAHIGVLRVLEREGFRVGAIAGTSFGGIVACFYAAGYTPDQIETIFAEVDQSRLYGRVPEENASFLGLSRVRHWLNDTLGERTFADAHMPCAVTAVDLRTSREIVIREGRPPGRDTLHHRPARHLSIFSEGRVGACRRWVAQSRSRGGCPLAGALIARRGRFPDHATRPTAARHPHSIS